MESLYEVNLSLFGGDLLVELPQDSKHQHVEKTSSAVSTPLKKFSQWSDLNHDFGQDITLATGHTDPSGLLDPFDDNWLDRKMDLLEFICSPETSRPSTNLIEIEEEEKPTVSFSDVDLSAQAVQLLTEAANEAVDLLNHSDTSSSPELEEPETVLMDLLEETPDSVFDMVDAADLLSPMSPEDIESILSSEPGSPARSDVSSSCAISLDASELSDLSVSSKDSSFLSIELPQSIPIDSELAKLLQSVEAKQVDDTEYVTTIEPLVVLPSESSPVIRRKKPYDRKIDKAARAKMTKEEKMLDRKLRKKQQNKDAAIRYRQKKKEENNEISTELDELEKRNTELKDTVSQMTGEIQYLKNLLAEVYEARGLKVK